MTAPNNLPLSRSAPADSTPSSENGGGKSPTPIQECDLCGSQLHTCSDEHLCEKCLAMPVSQAALAPSGLSRDASQAKLPAAIVYCDMCGGSGYFRGTWDQDIECHDCGGAGSWEAEDEEETISTLTLDDLRALYAADLALTEVEGDPMLKARAA